jgi:hypothetical protein
MTSTNNNGERNELLAKLALVHARAHQHSVPSIGMVVSVGGGDCEYLVWDSRFPSLREIARFGDQELKSLAHQCGIKKAGPRQKADVVVNGVYYSLKSMRNSPPAIVNHTPRPGWERAAEISGASISILDQIIDNYWLLRSDGVIGEDVRNSDPVSPFRDYYTHLKPLLDYFLFTGTGSGPSENPATAVLDVLDPLDIESWVVNDHADYLASVWDLLIFSVRSKGMPDGDWRTRLAPARAASVARWTKHCDGRDRGALHVRIRKSNSPSGE